MDRSVVRLAVLFCVLAGPGAAQEGGVVAESCKDDRLCVDDVLEIVFESGSSTYDGPFDVGVEVPIEVVIDAKSPDIQGYSWGVKHDGESLALIAERVTTAGTILDPESPDTVIRGEHFAVHRAVEGGFISAVALSLREHATLPLGRYTICRAAYRIAAAPECTVIRFVDRQLAVPRSPSVSINITTMGRGRTPRLLRQGLIRAGDCAETCDDLADNDGDGLADCEDADCDTDPHCTRQEVCDDGLDNDSNGWVDCGDPDCGDFPDCPREECGDRLDNDGDGRADCADPDCGMHASCVEVCGDGVDNDGDSLTDCRDRDCSGVAGCPGAEVCDDERDNDGDGLADCQDADCRSGDSCVEVCDDGTDDDGDEWVDCDDPDCWALPGCRASEVCDDGIDNDRDFSTDCDDWDCGGIAGCPEFEVCGDGRDNDEDGFTDCQDSDCLWQDPCVEVCDDGIDNDGNGFVDGLDAACHAPPAEPGPPPPEWTAAILRGDADGSGRVTVLDAIIVIQIVVNGEAMRYRCAEALNTNGDDGVSVADALPILRWVFLDGPDLPAPFPECGVVWGRCESSPGCP